MTVSPVPAAPEAAAEAGAVPGAVAVEVAPHAEAAHDSRVAVRNAAKLGSSLVLTWGVGLVIRFWIPRHLGPDIFGQFNRADALTANLFALTYLGLDNYIQKTVAVRLEAASEFFGGVLSLRAL